MHVQLGNTDTSGTLRIPYPVHIRYEYVWDMYLKLLFLFGYFCAQIRVSIRLGLPWIWPKNKEEGLQAVDDEEERPRSGSGAVGGAVVAHFAGAIVLPFLRSRRRGHRCPCRLDCRAALPQLPSPSPAPLGRLSHRLDAHLCRLPRHSTDPTKEPTSSPLLGAVGHRRGGVGARVIGRGRSQIR
jgi:hypothetical protein